MRVKRKKTLKRKLCISLHEENFTFNYFLGLKINTKNCLEVSKKSTTESAHYALHLEVKIQNVRWCKMKSKIKLCSS